jgi:anti-sigma B factor antagonist
MEIQIIEVGSVMVASLVGDLDGNTAPQAQEQILVVCGSGVRILLDMTQLDYMSSAGARTLLLVYRQIKQNDGAVALAGLNQDIADMLSATGFLDYFQVAATVDEGLALFGTGS